jgi:hypothetical protein
MIKNLTNNLQELLEELVKLRNKRRIILEELHLSNQQIFLIELEIAHIESKNKQNDKR